MANKKANKTIEKTPEVVKPIIQEKSDPSERGAAEPGPVVQKRQFELSEDDIRTLNAGQYGDEAWEKIGRKHRIDPTTREKVEGTNGRGFVAVPKKWPALPQKGGILTTKNFTHDPDRPVSVAEMRDALRSRDLTTPVSDETSEEQI